MVSWATGLCLALRRTPAGELSALCSSREEALQVQVQLDAIACGYPQAGLITTSAVHWNFKAGIRGTVQPDGRILLHENARPALLRMALAQRFPGKRFSANRHQSKG